MQARRFINPLHFLLFVPIGLTLAVFADDDHSFSELWTLLAAAGVGFILVRTNKLPSRSGGWFTAMRNFCRRSWIACCIPAASSVMIRLLLLPWVPAPHPILADEYSHLLLAKTLLLGRWTNPAHPLWQHFETLHVIPQPTYSSMYPMGQASFLALGKLLTGNEFGGVLLATALFCGALTWFLQAYVPPAWALYGGMLTAIRFGATNYWNNSYWGGSVAALGSALALGAHARLLRSWSPGMAVSFALGLALMANTRPYEGGALSVLLILSLGWNLWKSRREGRWQNAGRIVASMVAGMAVLLLTGAAMVSQWKAVTGSYGTLPYQVNQRMYGWPMTLPWTPLLVRQYRHPEFAKYWQFEQTEHEFITHTDRISVGIVIKFVSLWRFYFGVAFAPVLFFAGPILCSRRFWLLWFAGGIVTLLVFTEQSGFPHYLAPAAPIVLLFVVQGIRRLAQCGFGRANLGVMWVCGIPAALLTAIILPLQAVGHPAETPRVSNIVSWCCTDLRAFDREMFLQQLRFVGGKHLVFVNNNIATYNFVDWVQNEPDIDRAPVVFARDMGELKNRELLQYYPDRRVWRISVVRGRPDDVQEIRR
jgi:hypothetical protein